MQTDSYFRMGSTHAVCQDYTIAGKTEDGVAYAILSDGCSGTPIPGEPGSPYTDFGARFLVRAAQRHVKQMSEGVFSSESIITEATAMRRQCELPRVALDATLLVAVTNAYASGEFTRTYHTGDGVIASLYRCGKIVYRLREFGNNAPYYLNYTTDSGREQSWLSPTDPTLQEDAGKVTETMGLYHHETKMWDRIKTIRSGSAPLEVKSIVSHKDVAVTLLMSDGVTSFREKATGLPVPLEEVLSNLLDFRSLKGVFLTRNCNYFLHKVCAQKGWQHTDDFSIAGIYHGELAKPETTS